MKKTKVRIAYKIIALVVLMFIGVSIIISFYMRFPWYFYLGSTFAASMMLCAILEINPFGK